jgi:hypothetical protein
MDGNYRVNGVVLICQLYNGLSDNLYLHHYLKSLIKLNKLVLSEYKTILFRYIFVVWKSSTQTSGI